MGYTHESNLTNPKTNPNPNRNPLTLTETLIRTFIRTNETHHRRKSQSWDNLAIFLINWN